MGRRSSRISNNKPRSSPQGLQAAPSAPTLAFEMGAFTRPRSRRTLLAVLLGISLIVVCAAIVAAVFVRQGNFYFHDFYFRISSGAPEVVSPEMRLCEEYKALKNAGDPATIQLLDPPPVVPVGPISEEEADRFQTNCFLHQNIRILSVRVAPSNQFVLVAEGNVSAPEVEVRTVKGINNIQRTMSNPDLIVEVREGKIHGVRAELGTGR